jgi:hypothetical protein
MGREMGRVDTDYSGPFQYTETCGIRFMRVHSDAGGPGELSHDSRLSL